MEEIVNRLIENHRIDEMAYERADAIDKCDRLGKQFIDHFHKVYAGGVSDNDFQHHCQEMQAWYDDVKDIILRYNKKRLSNDQLVNWFFTKGSSVEVLFKDDSEGDTYDELMIELLSYKRSKKVVDIMRDLLSTKEGI